MGAKRIGPVLGPPVGGLIITWLEWRWIFYVNIPIGCTGALAPTASRLAPGHAEVTPAGFSIAFPAATAVSLLACPVNAALPCQAGAAVSGHRDPK